MRSSSIARRFSRSGGGFSKKSRSFGLSIEVFKTIPHQREDVTLVPVSVALVDNATSAGNVTLFSSVQLRRIIIHSCSFTATSLKYSRVEVYKYIHTYVQHVQQGRDRRPRSPSESRDIESRAFSLKRSITRGRKINDGVRKGMPLRRQAAVIDFAIRPRRHRFSSR